MVESTIEPKSIEIQKIKGGKVELLAHWDIEQIEREGQTLYKYEECAMRGKNGWTLPYFMATIAEVEAYLTSVQAEILDWAKGSKVTLSNGFCI